MITLLHIAMQHNEIQLDDTWKSISTITVRKYTTNGRIYTQLL